MWYIKSSNTASAKNVNPPVVNGRDTQEQGATLNQVVVDRPLPYANVDATDEAPGSEEEGLTIVPPGEEGNGEEEEGSTTNKDDGKEDLSDLSLSPNQLSDSLLAAVQKFEDNKNRDADEPTATGHPKKAPFKADQNTAVLEDDDEGVLVEELTKEEEALLASLDAAAGSISQIPQESSMDSMDGAIAAEEKAMEELQVPRLDDLASKKVDSNLESPSDEGGESPFVDASEKPAEEVSITVQTSNTQGAMEMSKNQGKESASKDSTYSMDRYDTNQILLPVWRMFTMVLSVAAFTALAIGNPTLPGSVGSYNDAQHMPPQVVTVVEDVVPMSPPMQRSPLALTWFNHEENSTAWGVSTNIKVEIDVNQEDDSEVIHSQWSGWSKLFLLCSLLVMYYFVLFTISSPNADRVKQKVVDLLIGSATKSIKSEFYSLNSFEGLLAFQKRFIASGKGRRRRGGKLDVNSYNKLTRDEILKILDGFGQYQGRDAAKLTLIQDLCSVYEAALYHFSNPQILEILHAKGFSVNTNMTKQDLVSLAVKVGF